MVLPKISFHATTLANICNQRLGKCTCISDYFVSCWKLRSMLNNLEKRNINLSVKKVFGIFCSLEETKHVEMLHRFQIVAKEYLGPKNIFAYILIN